MLTILATILVVLVFAQRYRINHLHKKEKCVAIVLGSGGHTAEMLRSITPWKQSARLVAICANSDLRSPILFEKHMNERGVKNPTIFRIPRARVVSQSWLTTPFTVLISLVYTVSLLWKCDMDVLLCNGPGTCVPVCVVVYIANIFGLLKTEIVFIESVARVKSLSLSGKIVYYLADVFLVQWPDLAKMYPATQYNGRLV